MLVSPNVKGIVRDGRRGGYPLAELGVFGRYFRLGGPGFQNRHGSVVKGSEIYVSVGRHGGGMVATGRGDTFLEKHLVAGFCIVSSDRRSDVHQRPALRLSPGHTGHGIRARRGYTAAPWFSSRAGEKLSRLRYRRATGQRRCSFPRTRT